MWHPTQQGDTANLLTNLPNSDIAHPNRNEIEEANRLWYFLQSFVFVNHEITAEYRKIYSTHTTVQSCCVSLRLENSTMLIEISAVYTQAQTSAVLYILE